MPAPLLIAGALAGLVLGLFGAGGTVVGLPVLLYLAQLPPHEAIGSNALGVAATALALLAWRAWKREVRLADGALFTLPGLLGIAVGARLGLAVPGHSLVFLLGFVIFGVAGWTFYLARRAARQDAGASEPAQAADRPANRDTGLAPRRLARIGTTAVAVGGTAGFFGVGGGFLIVPGLSWAGRIDLREAARAGLLPIAIFAGLIGVEYFLGGSASVAAAGEMLVGGLVGGAVGIWLGARAPRQVFQLAFAGFLVLIGCSMLLH